MVIVDRFMKQIHAIPTNTTLTAEGYAGIFRDHVVFKLHGLPEKVISDSGPQFVSKFMTSLYQMLDKQNGSTWRLKDISAYT